ncbi:MAG: hypothetical protein WAM91_13835 [Candidatus Acidiferrales bacterium]
MTKPNKPGSQQNPYFNNVQVRGALEVGRSPSLTDEHNTERKQDTTQDRKRYLVERLSLVAIVIVAGFSGWQGYSAKRAADIAEGSLVLTQQGLHLEQRAWVKVGTPPNFPLSGKEIPVTFQVENTGRTPATGVQGEIIATVLAKGEKPTFDYSVGHPHTRIHLEALNPNIPFPIIIPVVKYGPTTAQTIVPDESLRQDIANGSRFIVFYGEFTYTDIFGIGHWTHFCTSSGPAALDNLRECIAYNTMDNNK